MDMPNFNVDKSIYSLNFIKSQLSEGNEPVCYMNLKFTKIISKVII